MKNIFRKKERGEHRMSRKRKNSLSGLGKYWSQIWDAMSSKKDIIAFHIGKV